MIPPKSVQEAPQQAQSDSFPLLNVAASINQKFRLFLSPQQQKGLATGLLIGVALVAVLMARTVGTAIRGRMSGK